MGIEYQVFTGLLTTLIAIVAVYIAWQQAQTAKQKLRIETYDRNLRIYEETKNFLLTIIQKADVEFDEAIRFRSSVSEADFLFGPEIIQYIDEIYKRAISLHRWNKEYCDDYQIKPEGYNHSKVVEEMHIELDWLAAQLEPAKEKFRKYLSTKN